MHQAQDFVKEEVHQLQDALHLADDAEEASTLAAEAPANEAKEQWKAVSSTTHMASSILHCKSRRRVHAIDSSAHSVSVRLAEDALSLRCGLWQGPRTRRTTQRIS